jgi:hypothetical protein
MKTIALRIIGLIFCATVAWIGLSAQEPVKKVDLSSGAHGDDIQKVDASLVVKDPPPACTIKPDGTLSITGDPVACAGMLKDQVTQLQQAVAQKDQQIAAMQANIVASQKMFGACFQSLADAEQRAAQKK